MEIAKVFLTSVLSVVALFVITKIMGHKQVAQLDFFDYVCGITIGSIGAEMATDLDTPHRPLIALVVYGIASLVLNLLVRKIPRTRKYINGTPTVLFSKGTLYRENLKKAKLGLSDFLLLCREAGHFSLDGIQTAIFEHNGKLSILPKSAQRPATPEDLGIAVKETLPAVEVIMDGRILGENLRGVGRDERWLTGQIKKQKYKSAKEIFLGIYQPEKDEITLYPKEK